MVHNSCYEGIEVKENVQCMCVNVPTVLQLWITDLYLHDLAKLDLSAKDDVHKSLMCSLLYLELFLRNLILCQNYSADFYKK